MFGFKKEKATAFYAPAVIDAIESAVYAAVKPLGFQKHGRTLHRFVSGDISQVINFQCGQAIRGDNHLMWVNIGIRLPECDLRSFQPEDPLKKYYHEYDCTIRTRLGAVRGKAETAYDLRKPTDKIIRDILSQLQAYVLPVFDILSSREAILEKRREFPLFDTTNGHLILLEEAMIYGRLGNMEKATERFNMHYQHALEVYRREYEHGEKMFLRKGQRVLYRNTKTGENETVTATKTGYVTLYGASRGHLDYLEALAKELGISLSA